LGCDLTLGEKREKRRGGGVGVGIGVEVDVEDENHIPAGGAVPYLDPYLIAGTCIS
jgi:hypothetical protein